MKEAPGEESPPGRKDAVAIRSFVARIRVDERVETGRGWSASLSEEETESIAQSRSRAGETVLSLPAGETFLSLHNRRRRVPRRMERDPRMGVEAEGWSVSISGVGERRYSVLRKSEALYVGVRRISPGILKNK